MYLLIACLISLKSFSLSVHRRPKNGEIPVVIRTFWLIIIRTTARMYSLHDTICGRNTNRKIGVHKSNTSYILSTSKIICWLLWDWLSRERGQGSRWMQVEWRGRLISTPVADGFVSAEKTMSPVWFCHPQMLLQKMKNRLEWLIPPESCEIGWILVESQ